MFSTSYQFTLIYTLAVTAHTIISHEKKNSHGELTVSTVFTAPGPMITAQSQLGEVTAQSRRGHSSITASSVWSRLGHSSITAQSRLAVTILVTVSSRWAVTVANFFLMGWYAYVTSIKQRLCQVGNRNAISWWYWHCKMGCIPGITVSCA